MNNYLDLNFATRQSRVPKLTLQSFTANVSRTVVFAIASICALEFAYFGGALWVTNRSLGGLEKQSQSLQAQENASKAQVQGVESKVDKLMLAYAVVHKNGETARQLSSLFNRVNRKSWFTTLGITFDKASMTVSIDGGAPSSNDADSIYAILKSTADYDVTRQEHGVSFTIGAKAVAK